MSSRKRNTIKNFIFLFINYILNIVLAFATRTIFLRCLNIDYLGLNSLFSNILSILSLAELGFGTAITFAMYKPMAEEDEESVRQLLQLFKKYYFIIGIIVLGLGIALLPFLKFLINGEPNVDINLYVIYVLYLLNSVASYFFAHRKALFITSQRMDIESKLGIIKTLLVYGLQIFSLLYLKNYYAYTLIILIGTILENIAILVYTNKKFSKFVQKPINNCDEETRKDIGKNVRALVCHKIGGVIVFGVDNLVISAFISLSILGYYSNYLIITTYLTSLIGLIITSVKGSIGNYLVSHDKSEAETLFNRLNFGWYWVVGFCVVCLINLYQPFIEIWLGYEYLLNFEIVIAICISFYLTASRQMVLHVRECAGLFYQDRYKSIIEGVINLVLSLIFVKLWGLLGVIIGTIVSNILVTLWIEPLVLYKVYFGKSPFIYYLRFIIYSICILVTAILMYILCGIVEISGFWGLIVKAFITIIGTNLVFILFSFRTGEFKYIVGLLRQAIIRLIKRNIKVVDGNDISNNE